MKAMSLLLKNPSILHPESDRFFSGADILIENGVISAIGKPEIGREVHTIDCTGKYAIPGLWECHAHLADYTIANPENRKKTLKDFGRNAETSWDSFVRDQFSGFLMRGITTVRDVGGPIQALKHLHDDIANGHFPGPEIMYAGPMLEKSPPAWENQNQIYPGFTVGIDTIADADALIEQVVHLGARLIKTFNKFDGTVYRHLIRKAADNGLKVTHDPGTPFFHWIPMDHAMDLGVKCFEHAKAPLPVVLRDNLKAEHDRLIHLPPENPDQQKFLMKLLRAGTEIIDPQKLDDVMIRITEEKAYLCPTLHTLEDLKSTISAEPKDESERNRQTVMHNFLQMNQVMMKAMIDHGVQILVGHDGAEPANTLKEMALLKETGLAVSEVIKGATRYPAQWFGIDRQTGTIEEHKTADIVLLNQNTLDDITNIHDVFGVVNKGKWIPVKKVDVYEGRSS